MASRKELSPTVAKYFMKWILTSTWYTEHTCDMDRFYKFVKAVKRWSKKRPSGELVRQLIVEHGGPLEDLEKMADHFKSLYVEILEYEDTPFPEKHREPIS